MMMSSLVDKKEWTHQVWSSAHEPQFGQPIQATVENGAKWIHLKRQIQVSPYIQRDIYLLLLLIYKTMDGSEPYIYCYSTLHKIFKLLPVALSRLKEETFGRDANG